MPAGNLSSARSISVSFLGGAGTVTGSKFLVEVQGTRFLVDCGLFQGLKPLRLMNWSRFPVEPSSIDAVVLTHAHLDHSGYLPLLVRNGFRGRVHCTRATKDLCGLLLPDSGFLQERDAEYANRHGFSKHRPALPLYTEADARRSLEHLDGHEFEKQIRLSDGATACFRPAGHILGSAIVELNLDGVSVVFSGDLGRRNSPVMVDPAIIRRADYLVVESTYGARLHNGTDPEQALADVVNNTASRGGVVLVPTFAVGRVQTVLYHLLRLKEARRIPDLPIFLDSPMAVDASHIFCDHLGEHRLTPEQCKALCGAARYINSVEESKALDHNQFPKIILAASGMATGGRVLHHLKVLAPRSQNTILFAGYQAAGTRGASMVAGAPSIKIHGEHVSLRAEVRNLDMLSAHADRGEILTWLGNLERPPSLTFITHGEPLGAEALREAIAERLRWTVRVPQLGDVVDLRIP